MQLALLLLPAGGCNEKPARQAQVPEALTKTVLALQHAKAVVLPSTQAAAVALPPLCLRRGRARGRSSREGQRARSGACASRSMQSNSKYLRPAALFDLRCSQAVPSSCRLGQDIGLGPHFECTLVDGDVRPALLPAKCRGLRST